MQFINGRLELLNGGEGFHDLFEQESIKYADGLNTQSKYKEWLSVSTSLFLFFLSGGGGGRGRRGGGGGVKRRDPHDLKQGLVYGGGGALQWEGALF